MLLQNKGDKPVTRRRVLTGGLAAGAFIFAGQSAGQDGNAKPGEVIAAKAIHQEENFPAVPQKIYEALLDSKQFTSFSGGRVAEISRDLGGTFSVFDGHIIGRNLELVANRRIVQAWRVVPWPEGVYSIARFEFSARGSGTHLSFDHTGFPSELAEHLATGWEENYWSLLRKYFS